MTMEQTESLAVFRKESFDRVTTYKRNNALQEAYQAFRNEVVKAEYAYNFFWTGVPIIQAPQDLHALQEIIWEVKPELIIETGIAWGGSLLFSASMLAILETCSVIGEGSVIGIDIDIRPHARKIITEHPLGKKIMMLEGSSTDPDIVRKVAQAAASKRTMVCLDSCHTHDHVLAELKAYGPLVSIGSYCMVGDTGIEDTLDEQASDRPWGKGNNPKTAVWEFLKENTAFEIDKTIEEKLIFTASPDGYLKRIE